MVLLFFLFENVFAKINFTDKWRSTNLLNAIDYGKYSLHVLDVRDTTGKFTWVIVTCKVLSNQGIESFSWRYCHVEFFVFIYSLKDNLFKFIKPSTFTPRFLPFAYNSCCFQTACNAFSFLLSRNRNYSVKNFWFQIVYCSMQQRFSI